MSEDSNKTIPSQKEVDSCIDSIGDEQKRTDSHA